MWLKGQIVSLPNGKSGVIQEVSVKETVNGLEKGRDRAKVRYEDGFGGQAEQWFKFEQLNNEKKIVDIVKDIESEMEAVNEIKNRELLDWIQPVVEEKEEIKPIPVKPVDETDMEG